jgi:hypothetical protein
MTNFETLTLPFHSDAARLSAMQLLAELVRQGVGFKAAPSRDEVDLVITFTGAH